jgi:hypothetical protein
MLPAVISVIILSLSFALIRRALGGWLAKGKVLPYCADALMLIAACFVFNQTLAVFFALLIASVLHFQGFGVGRHEPDGPLWNSTIRYGAVPLALAIAAGFSGLWLAIPGLALIVPLSVASCFLARSPGFVKWAAQFSVAKLHFLDDQTAFIDGHLAFSELGLGASWGLGIGLALALA